MVSERMQRQIDRLLDEAEAATSAGDWRSVAEKARAALVIGPENEDAATFLKMAEANGAGATTDAPAAQSGGPSHADVPRETRPVAPAVPLPVSFVSGRYRVLRLLGRGGRKRVYLARDERLGREVAFAVIPTDGLQLAERERAMREAQAMARLGASPHLVSIFDLGEEGGDVYTVQEYMAGGDVASLLRDSTEPPPLERTLAIAKDVCRALDAIHKGGIIHRDLKPANVFLAADGSARVGDLGLAATAGLDRITQHGTMLGTVAYMPPEQAMGGEVGPRSDLYSLGCMLYEMVTGRTPFPGDDPTAVISQHLNAPPVAPSWLTERCPPSLEALVLSLLAKNAAERPASALDVLAVLEGVDPTEKSASHGDSNALGRLAVRTFVGREKELDRLRRAFDEAAAGRGGLVMLVGEPGIGKTRTTQELETYAGMRGATVLWGHTHESAGAPPYWPWLQAGNQFVNAFPDLAAKLQLAPDVLGELGRLFPWLKNQPNYVPPTELISPEAAQFRLFDAYATLLRAVAAHTPLLVALDDLHWADKPTLLLLQHVARDIGRSRILIAANYRDTDITRQSALSESLAALNREPGFERIVLRGLSREETAEYIRHKAGIEPRREVLDRIFEETEGNAFFLSEVVNLMAEEGSLAADSVADIAIPDGVKEALGRRLNRLSPETNELLQVAAIIGREFTYDTLTLLGDRDDDTVFRILDDAIAARVIEELPQPGRYRFTHAQMQETLLAELTTTRRVRLHGQVGGALERRWGDRADDNAPRLANHFLEAALLSPELAEKGRRYAALAGRQAEERFAWPEAVRWYEAATAEQDDPDPSVLIRLSWAYARVIDVDVATFAESTFERALEGFRRRGDWEGFGHAVADSPFMMVNPGVIVPYAREALRASSLPPTLEANLCRNLLSALNFLTEEERFGEEAQQLERRLRDLLERHELPNHRALQRLVDARGPMQAEDFPAYIEIVAAGIREMEASGNPSVAGAAAGPAMYALLIGDLVSARRHNEAARSLVSKYQDAQAANIIDWHDGSLETLTWDVRGLEQQPGWPLNLGRLRMRELTGTGTPRMADLEETFLRTLQADVAKVNAMFGGYAPLAQIRLLQGRRAEATEYVRAWAELFLARTGMPHNRATSLGAVGEALLAVGDEQLCRAVWDEVRGWHNWVAVWAGMGLDPIRGQLALRLGLADDAERCFREGLEWSEREGCPVELGRNLQGLAAVAEARGDVDAALDLLDRAAAQYHPRGVKLLLNQVIEAKVRLQGLAGTDPNVSILAVSNAVGRERPEVEPAQDGTVTIMFSDIEGSTALNERLGDARWMEILLEHNAILDRAIAAHGGRTVKTIGDGYMVAFPSPEAGIRCALAIQGALAGSPVSRGERAGGGLSVRVRIGLHTGDAVRRGDDFFGREVNYAARVANAAFGGEVLVSEVVRERIGSSFVLDGGREVELKGFEGRQRVYGVSV